MKTIKHKRMNRIALSSLCGISVFAGIANGAVIYDNFDYTPGATLYNEAISFIINGGDPVVNFGFGQSFVVNGGDFTLDSLAAPILWADDTLGINAQLTLSIYADDGSQLPGNLLETITVSGLPALSGIITEPLESLVTTFSFSGTTLLEEGMRYWILATVPDDGSAYNFSWQLNNDDLLESPITTQINGGPWQGGLDQNGDPSFLFTEAAFRLEGTLVPAPGVLAGFTALGLMGTRRRRD